MSSGFLIANQPKIFVIWYFIIPYSCNKYNNSMHIINGMEPKKSMGITSNNKVIIMYNIIISLYNQ